MITNCEVLYACDSFELAVRQNDKPLIEEPKAQAVILTYRVWQEHI